MLKKKLAEQEEKQKFPAFPDIKTDVQWSVVSSQWSVVGNQSLVVIVTTNLRIHSIFEGKGLFHPPSIG